MSKADNDAMESLHGKLARILDAGLDPEPILDRDGVVVGKRVNAALASVARQFLKDNGIESAPGTNPAVSSLAAKLPFPEPGDDARH